MTTSTQDLQQPAPENGEHKQNQKPRTHNKFGCVFDVEISKTNTETKTITAYTVDRKLRHIFKLTITCKQQPGLVEQAMMIGAYILLDHALIREKTQTAYTEIKPAQRKLVKTCIQDIVNANEDVLINVYNNGRSLSLKKHSLSLLPKINTKHIFAIENAKRYHPFTSFKDLETKVPTIKDAAAPIVARLIKEMENPDEEFRILTLSGITPILNMAKPQVKKTTDHKPKKKSTSSTQKM